MLSTCKMNGNFKGLNKIMRNLTKDKYQQITKPVLIGIKLKL